LDPRYRTPVTDVPDRFPAVAEDRHTAQKQAESACFCWMTGFLPVSARRAVTSRMERMTQPLHPFHRYVALGDSFTEGVGDPHPNAPGGLRGWADRVAEVLARGSDDFAYANLAVRGKLIRQIADDQVDAAVSLQPDLITISAGGNDVIRPGTDPDEIGRLFDDIIVRLSVTGATIAHSKPGH